MFDRAPKIDKVFRRYPRAPVFARLAEQFLLRGRVQRAQSLCEQGCERFPAYPTGFIVLSRCYARQKLWEEARTALDRALRLDPDNPAGYQRLATAYRELRNDTLALKCLERAAALDPLSETLRSELASLARTVRQPAAATAATVPPPAAADVEEANEEQPVDEPFAQVVSQPEWDETPEEDRVDRPAAEAVIDQPAAEAAHDLAGPGSVAAADTDAPEVPAAEVQAPDSEAPGDDAGLEAPAEAGTRPEAITAPQGDKAQAAEVQVPESEDPGPIPDKSAASKAEVVAEPEAVEDDEVAALGAGLFDDDFDSDSPAPSRSAPPPAPQSGVASGVEALRADDVAEPAPQEVTVETAAEAPREAEPLPVELLDVPELDATDEMDVDTEDVAEPTAPFAEPGTVAEPEMAAAPQRDARAQNTSTENTAAASTAAASTGAARLPQRRGAELAELLREFRDDPGDNDEPGQQTGQAEVQAGPVATVTLAALYAEQGYQDQALDVYRRVLQLDPANETARRGAEALTHTAAGSNTGAI